MRIALDYDKTFTEHPAFWLAFASLAQLNGHEIRIVTIRDERYDRTEPLTELEEHLQVIWTRGVAKKWFCTHFADGWQPTIWIDDKPETILHNSETTPEDLAAWRAERGEAGALAP